MLVWSSYGHTGKFMGTVLALVGVESGRGLYTLVEELSTRVEYVLLER
jgi:hypothetical protein